jgi:hypothetical protein
VAASSVGGENITSMTSLDVENEGKIEILDESLPWVAESR